MNILVTGSQGLLGRELCKLLVQDKKHNVYAIFHGNEPKEISGLNFIQVDLSGDWNSEVLPKKIDTIFHLAQSNQFRNFPSTAIDIFNVNVSSTAKLLDYGIKRGIQKFIYTSSGGIYANDLDAINEKMSLNSPNEIGYYLGSKFASEILVQSYSQNMITSILRPFFIYGRNQNRSMLMPRLFDSVQNNTPIVLTGKKGIKINPIHVEEAAKATFNAMKLNKSSVTNLAGPQVISLKEISTAIGDYLGKEAIFEFNDVNSSDLIGDITKMSKDLLNPKINFIDRVSDLDY